MTIYGYSAVVCPRAALPRNDCSVIQVMEGGTRHLRQRARRVGPGPIEGEPEAADGSRIRDEYWQTAGNGGTQSCGAYSRRYGSPAAGSFASVCKSAKKGRDT